MTLTKVFLFFILILNAGCASIISGTKQSVNITTTSYGQPLSDSQCKLTNSKGEWSISTSGAVDVRKSYGDMMINCSNQSLRGTKAFRSPHEGIVWGNILLGGVIGWAVDAGRGAGFSYPQIMNVEME